MYHEHHFYYDEENGRIDIQYLLGQGSNFTTFDDVITLLEKPIATLDWFQIPFLHNRFTGGDGTFYGRGINFLFDDIVRAIILYYESITTRSDFHFNGIDNLSTYDDVVSMFGEPVIVHRIASEWSQTRFIYLYNPEQYRFLQFFLTPIIIC